MPTHTGKNAKKMELLFARELTGGDRRQLQTARDTSPSQATHNPFKRKNPSPPSQVKLFGGRDDATWAIETVQQLQNFFHRTGIFWVLAAKHHAVAMSWNRINEHGTLVGILSMIGKNSCGLANWFEPIAYQPHYAPKVKLYSPKFHFQTLEVSRVGELVTSALLVVARS